MLEWGDGFVPVRLGPGSSDRGLSMSAAGNDNFAAGNSITFPFNSPRLPDFSAIDGDHDGGGPQQKPVRPKETSGSDPRTVDETTPSQRDGETEEAGDEAAGGDSPTGRDERSTSSPLASGQTITLRAFVGPATLIAAADILQRIRDGDLAPPSFGDEVTAHSDAAIPVLAGEQTTDAIAEPAQAVTPSDVANHDTAVGATPFAIDPEVQFGTVVPGGSGISADVPEGEAAAALSVGRLIRVGESETNTDGVGSRNNIFGSDANDILVGGDGDQSIFGYAGDDALYGGAGNDHLDGGDGDDHLDGGSENDVLVGGSGNDNLNGGAGSDTVLGGEGNDTLIESDTQSADQFDGGDGFDILDLSAADSGVVVNLVDGVVMFGVPEQGADKQEPAITEYGGTEAPAAKELVDEPAVAQSVTDVGELPLATQGVADPVAPQLPPEVETAAIASTSVVVDTVVNVEGVVGTSFSDVLIGNAADNLLDGGDGNDVLFDGQGTDTALGGNGDDTLYVANDLNGDVFDGGDGSDTLVLSGFLDGVILDLEKGQIAGLFPTTPTAGEPVTEPAVDIVCNMEVFVLGDGNDTIVAGTEQATYWGGGGGDTFKFNYAASSGKGTDLRDKIMDFEPGDKIDLSNLFKSLSDDVDLGMTDAQMQKFVLIKDTAEFTKPGQLKLVQETSENGKQISILQGNIDYDSDVDFEIEFSGHILLYDDQLI